MSAPDDFDDGGLTARLMREAQAEQRVDLVAKGVTVEWAYRHAVPLVPGDRLVGIAHARMAKFREDLAIVLNTLQGLRAYDPR